MLRKILMLPLKPLALPLVLICMTVTVLVKLIANLSSYVAAPLMLLLLGFCVYFIVQQTWNQVAILVALEVLCAALLFGAVCIETLLESVCGALTGFLHS